MSFMNGFSKTANSLGKGTIEFVKDVAKGMKDAGSETIADTIKLKGIRHLTEATKRHGGIGMALDTAHGRSAFAHGLGKAAPSLAMAGLYGAGAKKVHDKMRESKQRNQAYTTYYGG